MAEYEELSAKRRRESDELAERNEKLGSSIKESHEKLRRAQADEWIPTPPEEEPDQSGPEADYPTKD
jgi:hypothetical protein